MFSDSLLPDNGHARRGLSTLISFTVETAAVALLILAPLLGGVAVPRFKSTTFDVLPYGRPQAPPESRSQPRPGRHVQVFSQDALRIHEPRAIPRGISAEPDNTSPVAEPLGIGGGVPFGDQNLPAILNIPATYAAPSPPAKPAPEPVRLHISHMEPGALVHQVQPVYPQPAKIARIQGTVQLAAIIARDGTIANLRVLSGSPLLVSAAVDAVRQWRYRPYILNGQAVKVETQISVNFVLGQQ